MPAKKDLYDQFMVMKVTQTGANVLTFGQVTLGMSLFDYAGLVISRVEYSPGRSAYGELIVTVDMLQLAICGSDGIADLAVTRPEVYDYVNLGVAVSGTPASFQVMTDPIIHDFSTMKGGGLLVPAQNIFLGMDSTGFAALQSATARVYFTVKALSASDFIELVQRLRVLST